VESTGLSEEAIAHVGERETYSGNRGFNASERDLVVELVCLHRRLLSLEDSESSGFFSAVFRNPVPLFPILFQVPGTKFIGKTFLQDPCTGSDVISHLECSYFPPTWPTAAEWLAVWSSVQQLRVRFALPALVCVVVRNPR